MKASDLRIDELLEIPPGGGVIRFNGERALILDTVALGLLRHELIERLGLAGARALLTRFGWIHGWRTAENMRETIEWTDDAEWRRAGGRLHTLQGMVILEPVARTGDAPPRFAEAVWKESYEAEQHLLHNGLSDEPVCWSLCGFASGYLSRAIGRDYFFFEDKCRGKGDATCQVAGYEMHELSPEQLETVKYFKDACLESAVGALAERLKRTEQKLRRRKSELARALPGEDDPSGLVARSEGMQKVIGLARRVAKVDSTVLVIGESGVGKERVARLLHDESGRSGGPFVAVNCAAVAESLLESELFGHVRGAFTGAVGDRAGLFEAAHGGTLFLDEIGEVTGAMQAKLLRVLQEREIRRVGENRARKVDVRIVAATNRDLAADVASGAFRKDLYYRLRVVELRIPPLRERRDDILPLARLMLEAAARRGKRDVTGLSPRAAELLLRHEWPGNVRELENAMESAVALAEGERVQPEDLPDEVRRSVTRPGAPSTRSLDEVERDHILAVLASHDGNQTKAAGTLGIGTATLYRKLKQYAAEGHRTASA